jgi:hypothetical protein
MRVVQAAGARGAVRMNDLSLDQKLEGGPGKQQSAA